MAEIKIVSDKAAIAASAAETACIELAKAIEHKGRANWVLAGGSTPIAAYGLINSKYINRLDWRAVRFLIGDERCVPKGSPEANWVSINQSLLSKLSINVEQMLIPKYDLNAELAATDYISQLELLKIENNNSPRLDHVWLGIGEDGHTLSLFPGQTALNLTELVVPVHNSPKAPADRISLSLYGLKNVGSCLVIASGETKSKIVASAIKQDEDLPIVNVCRQIENNGGQVTWLLDQEVAKYIDER
jgi:6-phosphogluconolactonase